MDKVIFFNITDVLNSEDYTIGRHGLVGTDVAIVRGDIASYDIDINTVGILNCIVEATGAELVLFSDWRRDGTAEDNFDINEVLCGCGLKKPFSDIVPVLDEEIKGEELEEWFAEHPDFTGQYVILDTAVEGLNIDRYSSFIRINPKHGLTADDSYKAIRKLNGKEDSIWNF